MRFRSDVDTIWSEEGIHGFHFKHIEAEHIPALFPTNLKVSDRTQNPMNQWMHWFGAFDPKQHFSHVQLFKWRLKTPINQAYYSRQIYHYFLTSLIMVIMISLNNMSVLHVRRIPNFTTAKWDSKLPSPLPLAKHLHCYPIQSSLQQRLWGQNSNYVFSPWLQSSHNFTISQSHTTFKRRHTSASESCVWPSRKTTEKIWHFTNALPVFKVVWESWEK